MRALRVDPRAAEHFPDDVQALRMLFDDVQEGQTIRAVPGAGLKVPLWILGSSTYGAQLAAALGLPYAFASHFAPDSLDAATAIYKSRFRPAEHLAQPYAMPGLGVIVAPTDEEARYLFTSQQQSFVNLRTGRPGRLPPPQEGYFERLDPRFQAAISHSLSCAVVGSPATVRAGLAAFIQRTGAQELIVTSSIHDHELRKRSFTLLAEAHAEMAEAA
jgi:luciferase family oxidoreductase group 1